MYKTAIARRCFRGLFLGRFSLLETIRRLERRHRVMIGLVFIQNIVHFGPNVRRVTDCSRSRLENLNLVLNVGFHQQETFAAVTTNVSVADKAA